MILELRASAQIHFSCISQFRIYTWTRGWWCFRTCCTSLAGSLLPTKPFDVIRCLLWHFLTKQTDVCDIKSKVIHPYFWIVQRALHSSSLFSILRIMLLSELLTLLLHSSGLSPFICMQRTWSSWTARPEERCNAEESETNDWRRLIMVIIIITPISGKWKAVGNAHSSICYPCKPLLEVFGSLSIIWPHNVLCWLTITGRTRRGRSRGVNYCSECEGGGVLDPQPLSNGTLFFPLRIRQNPFREHNGNVWVMACVDQESEYVWCDFAFVCG